MPFIPLISLSLHFKPSMVRGLLFKKNLKKLQRTGDSMQMSPLSCSVRPFLSYCHATTTIKFAVTLLFPPATHTHTHTHFMMGGKWKGWQGLGGLNKGFFFCRFVRLFCRKAGSVPAFWFRWQPFAKAAKVACTGPLKSVSSKFLCSLKCSCCWIIFKKR